MMSNVHIHAPIATAKNLSEKTICLDCKRSTRMIGFFTPWYGWDSTCILCGRSWQDSEWTPLDFVRQSRQKSIAYAKQKWRSMPSVSENHYGLDDDDAKE